MKSKNGIIIIVMMLCAAQILSAGEKKARRPFTLNAKNIGIPVVTKTVCMAWRGKLTRDNLHPSKWLAASEKIYQGICKDAASAKQWTARLLAKSIRSKDLDNEE